MATVTGLTKDRMLAIEAASVVGGTVNGSGHLVLTKHDGTTIDSGSVIGPTGPVDPNSKEVFSGIVVGGYAGGPYASVNLDPGQLDSGTKTAICDLSDKNLVNGAKVLLVRLGGSSGTWYIDTVFPLFSEFPRQFPVALLNNWCLYNDLGDPTETYGSPKYQMGAFVANGSVSANSGPIYASMTRYGVVRVEGLIQRPAGNPAASSIIAVLPPGMRPQTEALFNVVAGGGTAVVAVDLNGNIRYVSGTANTYVSLSSIRFRAKAAIDLGLAPFTALMPYMVIPGFQNYFGPFYPGGDLTHTAGYTIDPDGVVLFEGGLQATAAYSGGTIAARLTGLPFNYPEASHQPLYVNSTPFAIMRFGTMVAGGLTGVQAMNFNSSMAVNDWMALSIVSLVNPALTLLAAPLNAWTYYSATAGGWKRPSFSVTPDKQVFLHGLWNNGVLGTNMEKFTIGNFPRYSQIQAAVTNSGFGRLDISSKGEVLPQTGSNAWYSLDGLDYAAYR